MRTTLTIPDEYYNRIRIAMNLEGYTSVNSLILDLIRRKFSDKKNETVIKPEEKPVKEEVKKDIKIEPHQEGEPIIDPIRLIFDTCQIPGCAKRAVGLYKVSLVIDGLEQTKDLFLCTTHLQNALKSGSEPVKIG